MNASIPIPVKHFYVIRHGETEANAAEVMAGSMDSPLTDTGRAQAYNAKKVLNALQVKPKVIIHSHLSRARDTATILNETLQAPMVEDPRFAEICAGDLEGASYEITRKYFHAWEQAPGGEHPDAFFARVREAKLEALTQYDGPVLVVCHGGVMRALGVIHGVNTPGKFQNAHLYDFVPSETAQPSYPWDVYDCALCDQTQTLVRTPSELYDADLLSKAS